MCYLKTGEQKYLDWYNEIERYVEKHFIDRKNGEWYGYLHYDGTVANTLKGSIVKGPFHIPRMLLLLQKVKNKQVITKDCILCENDADSRRLFLAMFRFADS